MKNLLLPLLITLSTTILAKTPVSLFGVNLNDNILNYVTSKELQSKFEDYVKGFHTIRLKNPPKNNQYLFDSLFVTFDVNNKIGNVKAQKVFRNIDTCSKVETNARTSLMRKFNIEFERNPLVNYGFSKYIKGYDIGTECRVFSDDITALFIFINKEEYSDKYNEHLDSII